jgi:hypothetical protein
MKEHDKKIHKEVLKHKWIESEKKGRDVGFLWARRDWLIHHWHNFLKSLKR